LFSFLLHRVLFFFTSIVRIPSFLL
jgi:hypothetical protein